jgi:hypothetical protein
MRNQRRIKRVYLYTFLKKNVTRKLLPPSFFFPGNCMNISLDILLILVVRYFKFVNIDRVQILIEMVREYTLRLSSCKTQTIYVYIMYNENDKVAYQLVLHVIIRYI